MVQEPSFAESCLPLTMEMANLVKELLLPMLATSTRKWPFEDRVLAWLEPALAEDIRVFHDSSGNDMNEMFQDHQINHLDCTLLNILIVRLESIRPGFIER